MSLSIGSSGIKTFDPLSIKRNRFENPNGPDKRAELAASLAAQNDAAAQVAADAFTAQPFYPNGVVNPQPIVQTGAFGGNAAVNGDNSDVNALNPYLRETADPVPDSIYMECYYASEISDQPETMRLCEKIRGCCSDDCCSLDYQRLTVLYILIVFVVIFAVVGFIIAAVCFARSRAKSNKDRRYVDQGYAGSAVGSQGYPYASSGYGAKY